jgi:ribonucleoside-diphosphate reductase alpha chain
MERKLLMAFDGLRKKVFLDRYALKAEDGTVVEQAPEDMWRRVARGVAQVEAPEKRAHWEEAFYGALEGFKFVPGGRILSGAGTGHDVTYYNCFVIPSPEDSREGIIKNLGIMVDLMARGGGVGVNLSSLRPRGSYIKTVNGRSSGPCSWAELYSVATGDVIQQGGTRRGALMLMLNDDHPDIEEFISVKRDLKRLNHANLSVCVSDSFMEAVKADGPWDLKWDGKVVRTIKAADLWAKICESAWASGEPGLVWMERYNKQAPTYYYENIICVNPCGEQGLPEWGVCNLGALNLAAFVNDGVFDFVGLGDVTRRAVRFLDNVIDSTGYWYEENRQAQQEATRRIGLGTMGLADALIALRIPYGSDECIDFIDRAYGTIATHAYSASADLAYERGSFGKYEREAYARGWFMKNVLDRSVRAKIHDLGIRNAVLLTQAPTGTTSLLAGVSSGIEPIYDFVMKRTDRIGTHIIKHPALEEWDAQAGEGHETRGMPPWLVSANDLSPEDHVRVQAAIQRWTDSSISKTCNAPRWHTVKDVETLYMMAYDLGCKGVTYFRDGCREGVLSHVEPEPAPVPVPAKTKVVRPQVLGGNTARVTTKLGTMFGTIAMLDDGSPYEMFLNLGRSGSETSTFMEALGRLVSLVLQVDEQNPEARLREVRDQLRGIGGVQTGAYGLKIRSVPDAVAEVIDLIQGWGVEADVFMPELAGPRSKVAADLCPECGSASLIKEEGCSKCYSCGYSAC